MGKPEGKDQDADGWAILYWILREIVRYRLD
jgi:hypothetical protein